MINHRRNYGVDLLRLVLMMMVCVLHVIRQGGVVSHLANGTWAYSLVSLLDISCLCAVDGFAIISGYMAQNKKRNPGKIIEMWLQVVFYSFAVSIAVDYVIGGGHLSLGDMVKNALPVMFVKYWYFTAYFALWFFIPILNSFIFSLNEKQSKKYLLLFVAVFCIAGLINDAFCTNMGYSAIWVILLYLIGGLAKRCELFKKQSSLMLVLVLALSVAATFIAKYCVGIGRLNTYISPTILLNAIIVVVLFSRMTIKSRIIAKIAPLSFGIYLFQLNPIIWEYIIKDGFAFIAKMDGLLVIPAIIIAALAIFFSGLAADFVRTILFRTLRINKLANIIAGVVLNHLSRI